MWISSVWYSFRLIGATLLLKIRTYEKDNCHQPAAYPGVLPDFTTAHLDCHGAAIASFHINISSHFSPGEIGEWLLVGQNNFQAKSLKQG